MSLARTTLAPASALFLLACTTSPGNAGGVFGTETGASAGTGPDSGTAATSGQATDTSATDSGGGTSASTTGTSGATTDGSGTGFKFDTPNGETGTGGLSPGCEKIDFLFVVDNSESMTEEQINLVTSFPGFIQAIQDQAMAQDYHIMVVDTDTQNDKCLDIQESVDCNQWCSDCINHGCECVCNGEPCVAPASCEETLGAGVTSDMNGVDCNFQSGLRYMLDNEPDLAQAFQCAAQRGADGNPAERPMLSALAAITDLNDTGGCNEGFLRDDAILVVTMITDTDSHVKAGQPQQWVDAMVAAKNGDEDAVVAIGLFGDTDIAGGTCQAPPIQDSDRLREWAESFTHGQWASVCEPDYAPFFASVVSMIDTACDDFVPPG